MPVTKALALLEEFSATNGELELKPLSAIGSLNTTLKSIVEPSPYSPSGLIFSTLTTLGAFESSRRLSGVAEGAGFPAVSKMPAEILDATISTLAMPSTFAAAVTVLE